MTALPLVTSPAIDRRTYERLAKRAKLLSWLSLAWMTAEGAVGLGEEAAAFVVAQSLDVDAGCGGDCPGA